MTAPDGSGRFFQDLFVPFLFLSFNVGDFIGRSLPAVYIILPDLFTQPERAYTYTYTAFARLVFVPLFLLCSMKATGTTEILPMVFTHGVVPIIFMLLMAVSNGYVSSLCMMYGPTMVKDKAFTESAATMMVFFLTVGLFAGSFTSFVWVGFH